MKTNKMNLYLVTGEVRRHEYMNTYPELEPTRVIKLVRAPDSKSASKKFEQYYDRMSNDYGTSYVATVTRVDEEIV